MTQWKTDRFFIAEESDKDWPPTDAIAFLQWWTSKIEQVPEEHRKSISIEISSKTGDYDASITYAVIEISYVRPKTQWEMNEEDIAEKAKAQLQINWERDMLAKLKKKYESGGTD